MDDNIKVLRQLIQKYNTIDGISQYGSFNGTKFEPDSSPEAWNFYHKVYKISRDCSKVNNKRILKSDVSFTGARNLYLGGDCLFSFNGTKPRMKKIKETIKKFNTNNKELDSYRDKTLLKVELCENMHFTILNFGLLPVEGGINNNKGDFRFDKHLKKIQDIYKHNFDKKSILNILLNKNDKNIIQIRDYFSNFKSFDKYLILLYQLDERDFIYDQISNLCSKEFYSTYKVTKNEILFNKKLDEMNEYMNFAIKFWNVRHKNLKSKWCF